MVAAQTTFDLSSAQTLRRRMSNPSREQRQRWDTRDDLPRALNGAGRRGDDSGHGCVWPWPMMMVARARFFIIIVCMSYVHLYYSLNVNGIIVYCMK